MTDAIAATGLEKEILEEAHPQSVPSTEPVVEEAKSSIAKDDALLNNVASETESGSPAKDEAWYESQLTKSNAENKRRREKDKKSKVRIERLEAAVEELKGNVPTLENSGHDHDAFTRSQNQHDMKSILADKDLVDARQDVTVNDDEQRGLEAVKTASDNYYRNVGGYFQKEGSVSDDAYQSKVAKFNEALNDRSLADQTLIINELAGMGEDGVEALMNVANSSEALYNLANAKGVRKMLNILHDTKPQVRRTDSPAPLPDIGGDVGAVEENNYDTSTYAGVMALQASLRK